eukprot:jgi/Botrbrau1/19931/Bobra.0059s0048.1
MAGNGQQPKRRIQPEQLPPSDSAANPVFLHETSATAEISKEELARLCRTPVDLRAEAEYAKAHLGPGRRMWFELTRENYEVDYQKLLRENGVIEPSDPRDEAPNAQGSNAWANVVARIEEQYVVHDGEETDSGVSVGGKEGPGSSPSDASDSGRSGCKEK